MKKIRFKLGLYSTAIVSKILLTLLTFLSMVMINRCLGVVLKGEYAYINNWVTVLVTIFSLGVGHVYSTYHRKYGGEKTLGTFVALSLIQALVVAVIAACVWVLGADFDTRWMFLIATFMTLRSNILYIAAIEDVKKRDLANIVYKMIYTLAIAIVFVNRARSLELMLAVLIFDEIITVGGTFLKYKFRPNFIFLRERVAGGESLTKTLIRIYYLGLVSMLMFLMISLNYNLDVIMLRQMAGDYDVGLYSVGVNLANLLFLVPDAFKDVLFHKTAKKDSIKDITASIKINILLDIVLIVGFSVLGRWFIKTMYGEEFVGSFPVTLVLFTGSLSMVIYKMIHPLYISKGKQKTVFLILLISVIANAIANLVLIPTMGIMGAAVASVVSYTMCSVIFLVVFSREYGLGAKDILVVRKEDVMVIKNVLMRKLRRNAKTENR